MKTTTRLALGSGILLLVGMAWFNRPTAPEETAPPTSQAPKTTLVTSPEPPVSGGEPKPDSAPPVVADTVAETNTGPTPPPSTEPAASIETAGQPPASAQTNPAPPMVLTTNQVSQLKRLNELLELDDGSAEAALAPLRDWAKQDPAACCQWVLDNLTGTSKERCLEEAIGLWSAQSPTQALDWLAGLPTHEGNEGAFSTALNNLVRTAPAKAADWLQANPNLASLENWQNLFSVWGETDPAKAFLWASQKLDANMKDALLPNLLIGLKDPAFATALLEGLTSDARDAMLDKAIKAVPQGDLALALSLSKQLSSAK